MSQFMAKKLIRKKKKNPQILSLISEISEKKTEISEFQK